jgi:ABC-2 type transport system permease protein
MILRPITAILARELVRTLRQRGRLLSALVRPLLWLMVIGGGVETMMPAGGSSYRSFMAPGLLAMTLLFGAMLAALSLVHDRESGVLRMLLIAPIHHAWIVLARIASATAVALMQGILLLLMLAAAGYARASWDFALLAFALIMTAWAAACLGMLVAVIVRGLENYAMIMNVVIFPVFFLSGALYPLHGLPSYLRLASSINPFSYGVDLLKHATPGTIAGASTAAGAATDFSLATDIAVLGGFIVGATLIACWRFCQDGTITGLLRPPHRARAAG